MKRSVWDDPYANLDVSEGGPAGAAGAGQRRPAAPEVFEAFAGRSIARGAGRGDAGTFEARRPHDNSDLPEVHSRYIDPRTGAQYDIKEKAAAGPQGDFRVSASEAELRYRALMGLPERPTETFTAPPLRDGAFETERFEPEARVSETDILGRYRHRMQLDAKRQLNFAPSAEPADFDAGADFEDRGDYYVDPSGKPIDKKVNTIGPFGTEAERTKAHFAPSKWTRETVVNGPTGRSLEPGAAGGQVAKRSDLSALEARFGEQKALVGLVSTAFRGLFGVSIADHVVNRAEVNRRTLDETTSLARAIVDTGLLKPWTYSAKGDPSDRPVKNDDSKVYAVGQRAIQTLMTGRLMPELLDLPRAQKDDLAVALGRSIMNALTTMPEQIDRAGMAAGAQDYFGSKGRQELQKALSAAIKPELVQGLVPPEFLAARQRADPTAVERIAPDTNRSAIAGMPQRSFDRDIAAGETKAPVVTRATVGDFAQFSRAGSGHNRRGRESAFEQSVDLDESELTAMRAAAMASSAPGNMVMPEPSGRPASLGSMRLRPELPDTSDRQLPMGSTASRRPQF